MELVKDYDCLIHCHPGKANVIADALSKKTPKIRGKVRDQSGDNVEVMIAAIRVHSTIVEQIKEREPQDLQYE